MKKITLFIVSNSSETRNQYLINRHKSTIGLKENEYDIVVYNNTDSIGLTTLYNHALETTKTRYIIFVHNDVEITNEKWGRKLLLDFENSDYGILGVAGTTDLVSGMWWEQPQNMVGFVKHWVGDKIWENAYTPKVENKIKETVIVDGLFIAVDTERIKTRFDDSLFNRFHFYDIDFCMSNFLEGVKIGVTSNIETLHYSPGGTDEDWDKAKVLFEMKYDGKLPVGVVPNIDLPKNMIRVKNEELVSIVCLSSDDEKGLELVKKCVESFLKEVKYKKYEFILAINGSNLENRINFHNYFEQVNSSIRFKKFKVVEYDYYNFARLNNDVVKNFVTKESKYLFFVNNDIEFLNDCISRMVDVKQSNPNFGTIGARLHYENKRVQHAGIELIYQNQNKQLYINNKGMHSYHGYLTGFVLGNTAALMMIDKAAFEEFGCFNEEYKECFEDVELNLRLLAAGRLNYIDTDSVALHKESSTRNLDEEKNNKSIEDYKNVLFHYLNANIKNDYVNSFIRQV